MARLVIIAKGVVPSTHELGDGWTTVGRADSNIFQILESSISGRHCEVRVQDNELLVRDLLSTNGTFVGGRRISEAVVKAGETLRLGDVEVRFEADTPPPPASASPFRISIPGVAASTPAPAAPKNERPPTPASRTMPAISPAVAAANGPEPQFQILIVDDSMAFLELFGDLCVEFSRGTWRVFRATSADSALALLRDVMVDLVLVDVTMPMLDGLQLLNILNRRYPGMKVAVMTGNATEGKRADALANGAELFLEKPVTPEGMLSVFNMLQDLLSWDQEGFTGALRQVNLQEVIQVECNGRHSSVMEIRNPQARGQIFIDAGVVVHAVVGEVTGEPAFHRLLSLRGGSFQVQPFRPPPQRTINTGWEFLLMDAARATDEETGLSRRPAASIPPAADLPDGENRHVAVGENIVLLPEDGPAPKPVDPPPR